MSVEDLYKPHAMEKDQNAAMESLDEVESRKNAWEDMKTKNNLARFVDTELRGIENLAITKALEYQDVYDSLARDYGDTKVKENVLFELQDAIEKRMFFHEPRYDKEQEKDAVANLARKLADTLQRFYVNVSITRQRILHEIKKSSVG